MVRKMKGVLQESVVEAAVGGLQAALFPESEGDFKHGDTPILVSQLAVAHMGQQQREAAREPPEWKIAALAPKLHKIVIDTYLFMWEQYREVLVLSGLTLADRFKDEYNTTTLKVSRAHRKAVARRRRAATTTAANEQAEIRDPA